MAHKSWDSRDPKTWNKQPPTDVAEGWLQEYAEAVLGWAEEEKAWEAVVGWGTVPLEQHVAQGAPAEQFEAESTRYATTKAKNNGGNYYFRNYRTTDQCTANAARALSAGS